jgi:hypothetical protein
LRRGASGARHQIRDRPAFELDLREPEEVNRASVGEHDASLPVEQQNGVREPVEECAERSVDAVLRGQGMAVD